jgi:hypothetical protein
MTASTRQRDDETGRFTVQVLDYLSDSDEYPHPVQDVPLWSENYLTQFYDPDAQVGVYMHLSRSPINPNLWLENFVVYLPGNRFLVSRGYGNRDTPTGPAAVGLSWECTRPYVEWIKRFDGGARLVSGEELIAGPLADGMHIGVQMELTCRASGHVFDMGDMSHQSWAKLHYEQHCDMTGHVSYLGKRIEVKGTGLRDHSVGPRDLSRMGNHVWHSGQFPSGRGFQFCNVRYREGCGDGELRYAVVTDHDGIHLATMENTPIITEESQAYDGYEMRMVTGDGTRHVIRAEVLQVMPFSLLGPNEISHGNNTGPAATHLLLDCQARYEWDGEIGYGLTERSVVRPYAGVQL